ncbi:hypothetical protein [Streptomyces sp. NPDC048650]|uniref:hypothetical protein n=1 Tax=Streptomyces sp. NPDC048650 TaxID=3365583 RepID=UPI0037201988
MANLLAKVVGVAHAATGTVRRRRRWPTRTGRPPPHTRREPFVCSNTRRNSTTSTE